MSAVLTVTTWPWPQVFFLEYYTLLFALDDSETPNHLHLYELRFVNDAWEAADTQDLGSYTYIKYVTVADFGKFYVVTTHADNGGITAGTWKKDPDEVNTLIALPGDESPVYSCVCAFNGQAIAGGIEHGDDSNFTDMLPGTVAWSEVGKFDFRIGEVDVADGGKKFNRTSGYRQMPWGEKDMGRVCRVQKLGNGIMVYGNEGIALLEPKSSPFSTFSLRHISGAGIKAGCSMAGNDMVHAWLDNRSQLWICGPDYKPQKLGYKDFLEDLGTTPQMSYCQDRKRFYICSNSTGYCLTEWGLYSTNQFVTSVGTYNGELTGFFKTGSNTRLRLTTAVLDFGQRSLKTLETLEFGVNYYNVEGYYLEAEVECRTDYSFQHDSYLATGWRRLNPKGIVTPVVTGTEFRVKLRSGTDSTYVGSEANLAYIKMRVKLVDKHSVRGLYKTSE